MQKIIVENFGPIEYAEIELRDFVVLIGEQASGKSTLAKLVYFFNSLSEDFVLFAAQSSTNNLTDILNQLSKTTNQKFTKYFGSPTPHSKFKIQFYFSLENDKWVTLELGKTSLPNNKGLTKYIFQTHYSKAFIDDYNAQFKLLFDKITSAQGTSIKINDNDTDEEKKQKSMMQFSIVKETGDSIYNLHPNAVFFPASRATSVQFSELFKQTFYGTIVSRLDAGQGVFGMSDSILMRGFLDYVAELKDVIGPHKTFEKASENFEESKPIANRQAVDLFLGTYTKILKGKYTTNGDGERILLGDSNSSIPIEQASSGQQESLRILQDIFDTLILNLSAFRVIEEPEAHLFPSAQKYLIELLSLVVNTTSSQIFITTHSPYVLSVLANLLYASKVNKLNAASVEEIESKTEINHLTWLDREKFAAYTMDGGKAVSIFDIDDSGMIDQNFLDQISEDLGREFQVLHNIRLKQIKELRKQ